MARLTQTELNRYVVNEILTAAQEVSTPAKEMSFGEVDLLRCKLAKIFGVRKNNPLDFENMLDKSSIQYEEGWRFISTFLDRTTHYMFYDHSWDSYGVEFSDGSKISDVLERCFGFPFYITDEENTFVIGMNDHDYLIGAGRAADWVIKIGNMINVE